MTRNGRRLGLSGRFEKRSLSAVHILGIDDLQRTARAPLEPAENYFRNSRSILHFKEHTIMSTPHSTSTGHELSGTAWLDVHFESARPEYEESLRYVGIQQGWRVLDAGCGSGGFLPLLCELVGPSGQVHALDLAPENVAHVDAMIQGGKLSARITTHVGSMFALPFADATFDCVWSANVMQYLTVMECERAIGELKRVLKSGGTIAIKDFDVTMLQLLPLDPGVIARQVSVRRAKADAVRLLGSWCGPAIPSHMRRCGVIDIRRKSWLVERWAPVSADTRRRVEEIFNLQAGRTLEYGLPDADYQIWRDAVANPSRIIDDPDFCLREGFTVSVGRTAV
jgi:arsenite methyltransferase